MKLEAPALKLDGITHGFYTRGGGHSTGIYESLNIGLGSRDDRDSVLKNRARVEESMGAETGWLVSPYQIHSANVITVEKPWAEQADRKADALVTRTPGLALGIATADCGPVLFADQEAGVIGAAHAGWKGALTGVLDNTVAAMEHLGAERSKISAVLGPAISQSAYEVGPEFHDRFVTENADNTLYFRPSPRPGHHMFNLQHYITDRLTSLGLSDVNGLGICTYADEDRFFSYRRTTHRGEPDYGRQISAIMIGQD